MAEESITTEVEMWVWNIMTNAAREAMRELPPG